MPHLRRTVSQEVLPDSQNFTHLHLHTVYSLLDGAIRIDDLMKHVKSQGMRAVAMTDHGNMFGAVDFYESAKKHDIKPIIGSEFYVAPGSRFEQRNMENLADGKAYHLVLLAKNKAGYKNLLQLSSKAYTEGFYYKPRIDYDLLAEHSEGVIASTACLAGEVNRRLYQGEEDKAAALSNKLNEIMGKGNFFLEIMNHGLEEEVVVAKRAIELSKKVNIPLVLTNDSHFLKRQDQKAQEIMLRIQMNKKIDEPLQFAFNDEFYVKSPAEMHALFPEVPEAAHNTMTIADMVDLDFDFGHPLLPDFQTPRGLSLSAYLRELSVDGLNRKFSGRTVPEKYRKRLEYELDVIGKMGFDGYFLIVSDFIRFAKDTGIPVGPGRGSAAGSLVAFSLGITNIDPLAYDLLFERFLNPSRNEMPDIDIDFCRDRREEVINYVIDKYGEDKVSQIITFGTLSAKAVIKDVARVLGFNFTEVNAMTKNLPDTPGIRLDDALAEAQEVKDFLDSSDKGKLLYQVARTLEGVPRNAGKHAAGVVISPDPLNQVVPLAKDSKSGSVVTQFEKGPLEKVGLVKMDFLGLKNLTIIDNAVKEIERRQNVKVDLDNLPLDDPRPYELLSRGDTKGVFQVESSGITNLLIQAQPQKFEDIVACIALYRPGPLESGMTKDYISRKNGQSRVVYPHEDLKTVLEDTFGTFVYQEQIMLTSQIVGGFSMAEADTLRKAMGKKKLDVMEKMKAKFLAGAKEKGHEEKWASALFDNMAEFAKYGFNKSHSAAYGLITYQTAWLKSHYPAEFMKASLDADIENTDKLIGFIQAARSMGIQILPPDVNESGAYFSIISDKVIRYGLLGLKGVGQGAAEAIEIERVKNGRYENIADLSSRLDGRTLNRKLLESLIYSGALDSFGHSRAALLEQIDEILKYASRMREDQEMGQESLFGAVEVPSAALAIRDVAEWEFDDKLRLEKETLGLYLTAHPLDKFADVIPYTKTVRLESLDDGVSKERKISIVGVVEGIKIVTTRNGSSFAALILSDHTGKTEVRIYKKLFEQVRGLIHEGNILYIDTRVSIFREGDAVNVFVSALAVHPPEKISENVSKSLHLLLEYEAISSLKEKVAQLKKTLARYSGDNPVYLHYKTPENGIQVMKVHSSFFVSDKTELGSELGSILPEKHFYWRRGGKLYIEDREVSLQNS